MSGSVGKLVMNGADPGGPHDRRGGAITFISPCGLPLIPRWLSYVAGMSGVGATAAGDRRSSPAPR